MSYKQGQAFASVAKHTNVADFPYNTSNAMGAEWVRNPCWLAMPSVVAADNKFVGLFKVNNTDANYLALTAAGNFTVDWGDGSAPVDYTANTVATYNYSYSASGLDNTNGPVTFQDSGDTVTRANHGYRDGQTVSFYSITTTTGISTGVNYFVINATTNTFQLSLTQAGTAVTLTTDGTGAILGYKQAIVTVTPQAGQTLTKIDLQQRYNAGIVSTSDSGWLDVIIAGSSITTLWVGSNAYSSSTQVVTHRSMERFSLLSSAVTLAYLLAECTGLKRIDSLVSSNPNQQATYGVRNLFINCVSLTEVPDNIYIGSATTSNSMFSGCINLIKAPYINTSTITDMSSMFLNCTKLKTVPLYNTSSVTNFTSTFSGCCNLESVPLFNTVAATNMTQMFYMSATTYGSLTYVPNFNTSSVTTFTNMFRDCSALRTAPTFDYTSATSCSYMFRGCTSLLFFPGASFPVATDLTGLFYGCTSLTSVGALSLKPTNAGTDAGYSKVCTNSAVVTGTAAYTSAPSSGNRLTTTSATQGICTSIPNNIIGSAGMSLSTPASPSPLTFTGGSDDGYWTVPIPFDISFLNTTYNTVYVGTNSYLTFGAGSTVYSGLSASNPPYPKIMISAADNSAQALYYITDGTTPTRTFRMRLEGTNSASGVFGSPTMVTEFTFYESNPSQIDIQTGVNARWSYTPTYATADCTFMFYTCTNLKALPAIGNITSMSSMSGIAANARSITEVPAWDLSKTTNAGTAFNGASSLVSFNATGLTRAIDFTATKFSPAGVKTMCDNAGIASATGNVITLTNSTALTTAPAVSPTVTATAKSLTLTVSSATGLAIGQLATVGAFRSVTTPVVMAADVTADTITWNAHNFSNGQKISFSAITTVTNIAINTTYYIVNANTNTFQIALTAGGAAINLTGSNGNLSVRWNNYITNIAGTTITMDAPVGNTVGAGSASTWRALDVGSAHLKGYAITY